MTTSVAELWSLERSCSFTPCSHSYLRARFWALCALTTVGKASYVLLVSPRCPPASPLARSSHTSCLRVWTATMEDDFRVCERTLRIVSRSELTLHSLQMNRTHGPFGGSLSQSTVTSNILPTLYASSSFVAVYSVRGRAGMRNLGYRWLGTTNGRAYLATLAREMMRKFC